MTTANAGLMTVLSARRAGALVTSAILLALTVVVLPGSRHDAARASVVAAQHREPPTVVGLTLPEAQTRIEQEWYPGDTGFKLTIRVTPDIPAQVPPEAARVVGQTVVLYLEDSADVSPSAVIDLTVGSAVADLVGRTRGEAQGLIDALGLFLKPNGEGVVRTQDPEAGRLVPFGTTVVAILATRPTSPGSTGPIVPTGPLATVPQLTGLTEAEARAKVGGVDLRLRVGQSSGPGERTVTKQDPAAGTERAAGGVVTVILRGSSVPGRTVVVPDVTGLDLDVVRQVLTAAKLAMIADPSGSRASDGGLSFRQDPQPGQRVPPGTSVTVAFAAVDASAPVGWRVWPVGAAALALLLLALWVVRLIHRRRPPRANPSPRPADISLDPHPGPAPLVSLSSSHPAADLTLRVVPTADPGALTLTEDTR